jgi:hypothetical protein
MSINEASDSIKRLWGDAPVVDATRELRVIVQPCDVDGATPKDPSCCVFARACKRSFGAQKVLFLRRIAYVELPTEDGSMRVERFSMTEAVMKLIADFDSGNPIVPKGGFLLKPPTHSNTLDEKRRVFHRNEKKRKEALLMGKTLGPGRTLGGKPKGKEKKTRAVQLNAEVRNGRGMVHFPHDVS